jgi:glycosyltransferase involved in cell wall biosynthesis
MFFGIRKVQLFHGVQTEKNNDLSIIIPVRNEAQNLPQLFQSIVELDYSTEHFEILWVNDNSTDTSETLIENFINQNPHIQQKILQNDTLVIAPKKAAIKKAIEYSKYPWIVTTDADVVVSHEWLSVINQYIVESNSIYFAGMVKMQPSEQFLSQYQVCNWLTLSGFTMSGFGWKNPMIASGAFTVFSKEEALKLNLFEGNEHISSGDDVFLLQKMKKGFPNQVYFLRNPEAFVITKSMTKWSNFISQQKRWMKKTGQVDDLGLQLFGALIFLTNFVWILSVLFYFISYFQPHNLLFFIIVKLLLDYFIIHQMEQIYDVYIKTKSKIISLLLFPFLSTWISLTGFWGSLTWKGREIKY